MSTKDVEGYAACILNETPEVRELYFWTIWAKHARQFAYYDESDIFSVIDDIEIQRKVNDDEKKLELMLRNFFIDALLIDPQKSIQVYNLLPKDIGALFYPIFLVAKVLIELGPEWNLPEDELGIRSRIGKLRALAREDEIHRRIVALTLLQGPIKRSKELAKTQNKILGGRL